MLYRNEKNIKMRKLLIATSSFGKIDNSYNSFFKKNNIKLIYNEFKRKLKKEELINILKDEKVTSVIAGLEEYDKEVISKSNLKIIVRLGSGISNVNLDYAKKKKIKIFSSPLPTIRSVTELTVGALLVLIRNLDYSNTSLKNKKWKRFKGELISEKKILILGYGRIGKAVSKALMDLGAEIYVSDPKIKKIKNQRINKVGLSKGLKMCDVISVHTNTEKELIGKNEFKLMKRGSIILNCSRGKTISEKYLISSIKKGIISRAWLDVFNEEPYYGELTKLDNVFLTPHIGSFTSKTREQMEAECLNIIKNYFRKNKYD
tara:strand:- start:207 stop:1160 length:954 start_codon:yes stop_codon:yes gene_type:complete